MTDQVYDQPGHIQSNNKSKRLNAFRYTKIDNVWVVEMAINVEGRLDHFLVDRESLPLVLNLPESLVEEKAKVLEDGTAVSTYRLQDALVPTWIWRKGGIFCKRPKDSKEQASLARLLLGMQGPGRKAELVDKSRPLDYRLCNLINRASHTGGQQRPTDVQKSKAASPIHWPHATNPKLDQTIRQLSECKVIQAFPGFQHPNVNCYWLVEYQGQRFYRMQALHGESFYFSEADLERVIQVPNVKTLTWRKTTKGESSIDGYIACTGPDRQPLMLHRYLTGRLGEQVDGLTVDHLNWNKWDNRQENLGIANQSQQNTNRAPIGHATNPDFSKMGESGIPPHCRALPMDKQGHNAGFIIEFPLGRLPDSLRRCVRSTKKGKQIFIIKSVRQNGVTSEQQQREMWLIYRALLDGSFFNPDGSISLLKKYGIQTACYGFEFPKDVGFVVPHINWDKKGQKWDVSKSHPSIAKTGRKTRRVARNESPLAALLDLYLELLTIDPDLPVIYELQEPLRQAKLKRSSPSSAPPAKRQMLQ